MNKTVNKSFFLRKHVFFSSLDSPPHTEPQHFPYALFTDISNITTTISNNNSTTGLTGIHFKGSQQLVVEKNNLPTV